MAEQEQTGGDVSEPHQENEPGEQAVIPGRGVVEGCCTLLLIASEVEAQALGLNAERWCVQQLKPGVDAVVTGVSKANAAGALGWLLGADPKRWDLVLSMGVAGSLPGSGLELGSVVVARACVFVDEGVEKPDGFESCAAMGFGIWQGCNEVEVPVWVVDRLEQLGDQVRDRVGGIATVSICSGTAKRAAFVAGSGCIAEAMEGAAGGLVCAQLGKAFGEIRVISNTTGDRAHQVWNLDKALSRLRQVVQRL